jgi:hypothetical protein
MVRSVVAIFVSLLAVGPFGHAQSSKAVYHPGEVVTGQIISTGDWCYLIRTSETPGKLIGFCDRKLYLEQAEKILVRLDMRSQKLYFKKENGSEAAYRILDMRPDPVALGSSDSRSSSVTSFEELPSDGNAMLDACSQMINSLDSPSLVQPDLMKVGWCMGYIQGTDHVLRTLTKRAGAADAFYICIPDNASVGQVARVAVKWLREHPENLDKDLSGQLLLALRGSFECAPSK